ncbi:MAG TPA: hypothetical protein VGL82_20050 [Bryobacteraceae bacterium]
MLGKECQIALSFMAPNLYRRHFRIAGKCIGGTRLTRTRAARRWHKDRVRHSKQADDRQIQQNRVDWSGISDIAPPLGQFVHNVALGFRRRVRCPRIINGETLELAPVLSIPIELKVH